MLILWKYECTEKKHACKLSFALISASCKFFDEASAQTAGTLNKLMLSLEDAFIISSILHEITRCKADAVTTKRVKDLVSLRWLLWLRQHVHDNTELVVAAEVVDHATQTEANKVRYRAADLTVCV